MIVIILLIGIIVGFWAFFRFMPVFGGNSVGKALERVEASAQYDDGRFRNTHALPKAGVTLSGIMSFFFDKSNVPDVLVPLEKISLTHFDSSGNADSYVTWFGHSAVLLEIAGEKVFMDPMLGSIAGPLSWIGAKRFSNGLPLEIESLGEIDVVLISHDHYDHLDYWTIIQIKDRVGRFVVPLGVGAHLLRWGVDPDKITELDWWDDTKVGRLKFIATPAQHFSGRNFGDSNATLWSSWVVQSEEQNVFFSGDSGYNAEIFQSIGKKFGPFDFAMIECGQYDDQWPGVHMTPEQTVQVSKDVKAKLTMPIHWSSFRLALHAWDDPVKRFTQQATREGVRFVTPRIGESVVPGRIEPRDRWWEAVK